jgi:hypothetical protein
LDIGTGSGLFAKAFFRRGLKGTGVDTNPEMLPVARDYVGPPTGSASDQKARLHPGIALQRRRIRTTFSVKIHPFNFAIFVKPAGFVNIETKKLTDLVLHSLISRTQVLSRLILINTYFILLIVLNRNSIITS